MIQTWQMTPRHRALEILGGVLQSAHTLRAGVPEGTLKGLDSDGETDLTVLFGPQLVNAPEQAEMGDDWVRQVGDTACLLMAAGASPFVANQAGEDAFDLGAWLPHAAWIQALLTHADRPEVDTLLARKPSVVSARFKLALPSVWAMWARANATDAIGLALAQGGHLPDDILGWSHPLAVKTLLGFGAALTDDTEERWNKRVRQGDLKMTQQVAMRTALSGDPTLGQAEQKVLRNGDDLIRLVNHNSDQVDLVTAIRQFGPMGHLTKAQNEWGQKVAQWPLLAKLFSIQANGQTVQRNAQLLATMAETFDLLKGNPSAVLGHTGQAVGTVAQMMMVYLLTFGRDQNKSEEWMEHARSLVAQVEAWAGPLNWKALVTCADATKKGRVFLTGDLNTISTGVNRVLFEKASQLTKADQETLDDSEQELVALAIERVQQADQAYGFWDEKLHRILDNSSVAPHPHAALMRQLTPRELFHSLRADRKSGTHWNLAETNMLELVAQVAFESVSEIDEVLAELSIPRAAVQSTTYPKLVDQLMAQRRALKAGPIPEPSGRSRTRMRG